MQARSGDFSRSVSWRTFLLPHRKDLQNENARLQQKIDEVTTIDKSSSPCVIHLDCEQHHNVCQSQTEETKRHHTEGLARSQKVHNIMLARCG